MLNTLHPAPSRAAFPTGPTGRWQRLAWPSPFIRALPTLALPGHLPDAAPAGLRAWLGEGESQRAVRRGEAVSAADTFGNATALAHPYLPLPQQTPDPAAVRGAWKALTRFRNR